MAYRIHNAAVIATWSKRLAHHRRGRVLSKGALYAGLLALLLVALIKPPLAVSLSVCLALLVAGLANLYFTWHLLCPNCGNSPVSSPALADPDDATFCPKCMHLLTEGSD